ncbi:MAG: hypothetical protein QXP70_03330 [Methanomassiliicoccales archaeon]
MAGLMNKRQALVLSLALAVIVEYILGGFVTFDDKSNSGFALNSLKLTWPAVLPLVHRAFALFLILFWIAGAIMLRRSRASGFAHATAGLVVIQAIIGAFIPMTLSSPMLNNYVVIAHFAVGGLLTIGAGFTLYLGWLPSSDQQESTARPQPSTR